MRILKAIKRATYWSKALECASNGEFGVALAQLEKFALLVKNTDAEFHALRASLQFALGNVMEGMRDCKNASQMLIGENKLKKMENVSPSV